MLASLFVDFLGIRRVPLACIRGSGIKAAPLEYKRFLTMLSCPCLAQLQQIYGATGASLPQFQALVSSSAAKDSFILTSYFALIRARFPVHPSADKVRILPCKIGPGNTVGVTTQ